MIVIAIDGDAAAGKGTLARRLAAELGFAYLDTGLLYRQTAYIILKNNKNIKSEADCHQAALQVVLGDLDESKLRNEALAIAALAAGLFLPVSIILGAVFAGADFTDFPAGFAGVGLTVFAGVLARFLAGALFDFTAFSVFLSAFFGFAADLAFVLFFAIICNPLKNISIDTTIRMMAWRHLPKTAHDVKWFSPFYCFDNGI